MDSTTLIKLINNDEVTIGHELISLGDTQNYYIPRTFNYQTVIKTEIFKEEKVNYLLAISDIDEASLRRLVPENHKISLFQEYDLDKSNDIRSIILNNGQAAEQFKQLCQLYPDFNIHWLKSESDQLIWQQSQGSLSGLHRFIDESHTKYYSETELLSQTDQYKVMIISDTSGMGKSTVLTNLAPQIKEHDPALWLIRINLNEHTDQLKKILQHKLSMKTIEDATQFLANNVLNLTIPFEQALFKYYCQHSHDDDSHDKLIIMFDGFDEISPDYRDIVIDLMLGLRNSKIKQLWVTSRPTEKLILEEKLQNISYKLESFSEQNQIDFLTKFWKQTLNTVTVDQEKFKVYAKALIKLLSESTSDKDKEFTSIPLQIRMLAEVFVTDFETFYNSNTGELQLPTKLDLNDLYDRFFEKKYDIYQKEKNKLDLSKPRVKIQSDKSYAEFIGKHQNLALWTLFKEHKLEILLSEKAYQEFSKNYSPVVDPSYIERLKKSSMNKSEQEIKSFIDDIKEGKVNTGIVEIIENKPHFIHRTFAEYLVGKFLVASLDNETIVEFVLQEIFLEPDYQVTRAFLNYQLPESLPEDKLTQYGKQIERLWQSDQRNLYNKENRTLLHLAAEEGNVNIIRFFLNSLKGHEIILKSLVEATTYYNKKNPTALHLAAAGGYLDVVQCLVEHGADVNVKSNSGQSALHCAAQKNKWDIVQWLVEHGKANVDATDKYGRTVLHCAAQENKWDVVQWLVEHGKANVDATDNFGQTVLVWAAQENKWDVVQWLIEHGKANVEATSKYSWILTHMVASPDMVQQLQLHCADNDKIKDRKTMLHWAAQQNKWDVVQSLVEHGKANVEATDKYGRTVLHWAAQKNKWDVVQWLVEHGANVNVKGSDGETVLHWAARGNLDVVQWLVEHGADVNVKSKDGHTVLHCAVWGNLDVVQWLAEHGVDVNATDIDGKTPLNLAEKREHKKMTEYLKKKMVESVWQVSTE